MTQQWLRQVKLTIGDDAEELDLSALRIRFAVRQGDIRTPNWAEITVTNPAPNTVDKAKKEFSHVVLQAGYDGNVATIFSGKTLQARYGRENPTDTFLSIIAQDSADAWQYGFLNVTLAAGSTYRQQLDECLKILKDEFGVTTGYVTDLGTTKAPRGVTIHGMVRNKLDEIAAATNSSWSIQNGVFQMIRNNEFLPQDPIVLNSRTGLIGLPVQTIDGIEARCLLNPQIKPGARVKIDQASIQDAPLGTSIPDIVRNAQIPSKATDGLYRTYVVDHSGDTRGNPFYSDLICLRADGEGPMPSSLVQRGNPL